MKQYHVEFPGTDFKTLELPENAKLVDYLTPTNSPVLFGCCNGICATCLIEVEGVWGGNLTPKDEEEQETLENYVEGNEKARLACQLRLTANIKIKKIFPNNA